MLTYVAHLPSQYGRYSTETILETRSRPASIKEKEVARCGRRTYSKGRMESKGKHKDKYLYSRGTG